MEGWLSHPQALPRDFNFNSSPTTTPSSFRPYPSGGGFAIDGNDTSIGQMSHPHSVNVAASVGQAVELVLCLMSICMGLGIFLPSILRSNERTLRFQLIIGLSCSDFFLATLSFSEVIVAMAGKHPGTGSIACDITGFLTSTFVFAQYLWAIAMASATFLLLRKPTSPTTAWMSANWGWAWVVFYTISFSQAGIWWSKSRYELAGGFCYYGEQNALGGDLIQLIARALVLVIVSSLYANLFLFLRRPSIGIAGCASNTNSRRPSANTQASQHSGPGDDAPEPAPWEQIDLGFQIEEETLPEKLERLSQPTLSELGTPLRPDLQVEIPFRGEYFAPDVETAPTPSRTRSTTAPAPTAASTQQTPPPSPPKLFALSFSFGNPTTPAPRPAEVSPMDSPKATYHTPPRRSSLARHHRPSISDSSSHASPPRRVSFSFAPLGPTGTSPDIEAFAPPPFVPPSFADFTFGRPVVALMESSSFSSDGTNEDASQPTPSPTSHNLLSSPSSRRSSLPTSSLLLSNHPPTVGASRLRHLPPSSLRRSSLPISSLDPIVPPTTYAAQEASPASYPALFPRRTSLVAHLAEAQLVLLARGSPESRRESCDSATTAFDSLPSPIEGTKIMGGGSSCNGSEDSSKSFITDRRRSVPVLNRQESDGSTGTTSTGQGSNSFCSSTSSPVRSSTPHPKSMENSSSSSSAEKEEKIAPPPIVPRHASTVSSADTLTEDQPSKSDHPNLPKRKSFTRRQTLAEMSPSHVEDARSVVEGPSKATYMKRKASQLMIYLPTAYLFMFVVFLARFIDDRMHPSNPNKGIHALSRWVLVGQGVINGAIYGIVEHRARTSIRNMEKADEERRIEEEKIIRAAETQAMVVINTERRETKLRRQELSDESDGEGER